jgi:predicted ABC-type ATPase
MLMRKPHLWIIAGPNGAGKTSLVRDGALGAALSSCEFINPDALTLDYLKEKGINTWAEAESKPDLLLSTIVERVHQLGGVFRLVYVMLHSPHLSRVRVDQRSLEGGHDVPSEKLESRWKSSLEWLPWFASRADQFWILDNSESHTGGVGRLVFTGSRHQIRLHGVPAAPSRRIASEILTQHSRQSPSGDWRIELDDARQTFHS